VDDRVHPGHSLGKPFAGRQVAAPKVRAAALAPAENDRPMPLSRRESTTRLPTAPVPPVISTFI